MITLFTSVCIEAPADIVWARLAQLEDIPLWSAAVLHATCDGALSQGVGAQRTHTHQAKRENREASVAS
jgi:hypothetical protein